MTTTRKHTQFVVREVRNEQELALCLDLDHTYVTDYVWQMDLREENDDMVVRFRTVRLPRNMLVPYPRSGQNLRESWQEHDCFLVAAVEDVILGYVNVRAGAVPTTGWIHDLVVGEPFRRRRIGSALLEQAERWARLRHIEHLTIELQTKNFPGITFIQSQGFVFCGFNDHYYPNQDIAVFFGKSL
jgi:ribosomal protein S18 acetylase RimI-like enzyme